MVPNDTATAPVPSRDGRVPALALLLASLLLAFAAQAVYQGRTQPLWLGSALYILALFLFWLLERRRQAYEPLAPDLSSSLRVTASTRLWVTAALALLLSLAAGVWVLHEDRSGSVLLPAILWLLACALLIGAAWRHDRSLIKPQYEAGRRLPRQELAAVLACTLLALALRLWQLAELPYPLNADEAAFGLETRKVLTGEIHNPFGTSWSGIPTMWFFVQAPFQELLGRDLFSIRLPSALLGAASVPLIYLLARSLFGARVGLVSAVVLAAMPYHLHFSRMAINNVCDPFFGILTAWLLVLAWQRSGVLSYTLAGASLALMQYGYPGGRVMPFVIGAWLLMLLWQRSAALRERFSGLLFMAAGALVVALPLIRWYAERPDTLTARVGNIGLLQSPWLPTELARGRNLLSIVGEQLSRSALAFNYYSDTSSFFNSRTAILTFLSGVLFVYGVFWLLNRWRQPRSSLLLLWLTLTLLVGGILTINPPTSTRFVVLGPPVAIAIAIGLCSLVETARQAMPLAGQVARGLLVASLAVVVALELQFYFITYPAQYAASDASTEIAALASHYLAREKEDHRVYLLGARQLYLNHPPFPYLSDPFYTEGRHVGVDLEDPVTEEEAPATVERTGRLIFIVLQHRLAELPALEKHYPGGQLIEFNGHKTGSAFIIYRVD